MLSQSKPQDRATASKTATTGSRVDPVSRPARASVLSTQLNGLTEPMSGLGEQAVNMLIAHCSQTQCRRHMVQKEGLTLEGITDSGCDALIQQDICEQAARVLSLSYRGDDGIDVWVAQEVWS